MGSMTTLPRGREFTREDRAAMPDDGNRYELVDGALIVSPSPKIPHQAAVVELAYVLRARCPEELRVYVAPLDIELDERTVVQPDLLVTTAAQASGTDHVGVPLLVVEVLSPSTRHIDLGLKRSRFEAGGVASYWVVDPEEPSILAWERGETGYVEVGRAAGDDALELAHPFAIRIVPASLVR